MSQSIKKKLMALIVVGVMAIPMASFAQEVDTPILISENQETKGYIRDRKSVV